MNTANAAPFYRAFEDRYRGSQELIKQRLSIYVRFLQALKATESTAPTALDLGCGRGEWLQLLGENGFQATGIDLDDGMLVACREQGLSVEKADVLTHLQRLPDSCLSLISAFHLVEHLPFGQLQAMVAQCHRVLRPGGLLIMETPNPENLAVGTSSFYLDPSHEKPIPHQLLSFLTEHQGFERNKVVRLNEPFSVQDAPTLWDVIAYSSPDYAVVAQKAGAAHETPPFDDLFDQEYGVSLQTMASRYQQSVERVDQLVTHLSNVVLSTDQHLHQLALASQRHENSQQQLEATQQAIERNNAEWQSEVRTWRALAERRLVDHETALTNANASLVNAVERLNRLEQHGPWPTIKTRVIKPLLRTTFQQAEKWLAPFPNARAFGWRMLGRIAPGVQARIQARLHRQHAPATEQPVAKPETPAIPQGYFKRTATPAPQELLDDPALTELARPTDLDKYLQPGSAASDSSELEPVTTLLQMRTSRAGVAFVITLNSEDPQALTRSIQSVLRQTDPTWEILLCGPDALQRQTERWLDSDWRIRRVTDATDVEVSNLMLASGQATCAFLGLISPGDEVDDELVSHINQYLKAHPNADLIYTDEASPLHGSAQSAALHKPDWSPEHQYSTHLLGRFVAIRKTLVLNLDLPTCPSGVANEFRLALELGRIATHIGHLEEVLYLRGQAPAGQLGLFAAAELEAAHAMLTNHLQSVAPGAQAVVRERPGCLQVRWPLPEQLPVTLLILTNLQQREIPGRGTVLLVEHFVESIIRQSTHTGYKILVVSDEPVPDALGQRLRGAGHDWALYEQPPGQSFSFARKSNFATSLAPTGVAILLNDDLEVIAPDWIEALAGEACRTEVGIVGAKLLYPDDTIQHAGMSTGLNGSAGHLFHHRPVNSEEYAGLASITRNCSAVTGAVMAYRTQVFEQLGGFDEVFRVDYNDIDLCLRAIEAGYRVVYSPWALLYHFHNSSFKRRTHDLTEQQAFVQRWSNYLERDPLCGTPLQAFCVGQGKGA